MPGETLITSPATSRATTEGTANKRQPCVWGSGPSRARCIQSMARRKQTTASPEKIPMNTERIRKNTSSLKTPSRVENNRGFVLTRATVGVGEAEALTVGTALLIDLQPRAFLKSA